MGKWVHYMHSAQIFFKYTSPCPPTPKEEGPKNTPFSKELRITLGNKAPVLLHALVVAVLYSLGKLVGVNTIDLGSLN